MRGSFHSHRRRLLGLTGGALVIAALDRAGLRIVSSASAQASADRASTLVMTAGDDLVAVINGPGTIPQKRPQLVRIIETAVDVDGVAKFCLGRFWRQAAAQQQKEYLALFRDVLVNNITGKLGEYQGVKFTLVRSQARDDSAIVSTIVERPNNPPSQVDWVVSEASGAPKVVDVIAEGTSLRLTQRSDYASYLSRNGSSVQALIDAMRQQLAQSG